MGCIESSGSLAWFASILSYSPPFPSFPSSSFFIAVIRFQPPPFGERDEKKGLRHRRKTSSLAPDGWDSTSFSLFLPFRARLETGNFPFDPCPQIIFPSENFCQIGLPYTVYRYRRAICRCALQMFGPDRRKLRFARCCVSRSHVRIPNLFHAFFPILFPCLFSTVLIYRD